EFSVAIGESQVLGDWQSAEAVSEWLAAVPQATNSGDIYARSQREVPEIAERIQPAFDLAGPGR
ncbi:MAG: hypothetical protein JOY64_36485, partial [Alphaproteobacteria bacterium]|nr:hypothetical protein [Alphaproteobacteria bacterium]